MFRVVITSADDNEHIRYEKVTSPEHACKRISEHIWEDINNNDRQWNYDLEQLKDGEWESWEDKNYQCIGDMFVNLYLEEEDDED